MIKMTFSAIALAFLAGTAVQAASPKSLGQFNSWSAATYDKGDLTHCFIMSKPAAEDPSSLRHGDVFFFVQTADNGKNTESSFQTGYDFAANSTVTVTIGDDEFRMLTQGSNAWLEQVESEPALLAAMRSGARLIPERLPVARSPWRLEARAPSRAGHRADAQAGRPVARRRRRMAPVGLSVPWPRASPICVSQRRLQSAILSNLSKLEQS